MRVIFDTFTSTAYLTKIIDGVEYANNSIYTVIVRLICCMYILSGGKLLLER